MEVLKGIEGQSSTYAKMELGDKDIKICGVCGDKALGYNFCAVTCESCKAFFRRNALTKKDFRCPFKEQCEITAVTRRFCQKCRLEKCFAIGMRKDYIMSEEDKLQKRQKIEQNRARKRTSTTFDPAKKIKRDYSSEESIDYNCKSVESSPELDSPESFSTLCPPNIVSVIKNGPEIQDYSSHEDDNNILHGTNHFTPEVQKESSMIRHILNPTPNGNLNTSNGNEDNSPLLSSLINNNDVPCNRNNSTNNYASQSNTDVTRDVLQDVQRLILIRS